MPNWETVENYQVPRILFYDINQGATVRLILHATDQWNDTGLTPNIINVYIDQNASGVPVFNQAYYQLHLTTINSFNGIRPNSNIVYNRENPLNNFYTDKPHWYTQYYHLFENDNNINDQILPNQIVNDPINFNTGIYSEEGMHRIEVILKSDSFRNPNGTNYIRNEKNGILYYYLLKNNGGYMDLAQSGTYN